MRWPFIVDICQVQSSPLEYLLGQLGLDNVPTWLVISCSQVAGEKSKICILCFVGILVKKKNFITFFSATKFRANET